MLALLDTAETSMFVLSLNCSEIAVTEVFMSPYLPSKTCDFQSLCASVNVYSFFTQVWKCVLNGCHAIFANKMQTISHIVFLIILTKEKRLFSVNPGGSVVKDTPAKAGELSLIPRLGRSPGEGNGNALQYSCLGNPINRGVWWATVLGVVKELDTTQQLNNNNKKKYF